MRGKQYWLEINPNFTVEYGSPIERMVTSFYTNISTWVTPDKEPTPRQITNITKRIKQALFNSLPVDGKIIYNEFIVTAGVPEIGIKTDKRTYVNWEITCYLKEAIDITDPLVEAMAKELSGCTLEVLGALEGFKYYYSKK